MTGDRCGKGTVGLIVGGRQLAPCRSSASTTYISPEVSRDKLLRLQEVTAPVATGTGNSVVRARLPGLPGSEKSDLKEFYFTKIVFSSAGLEVRTGTSQAVRIPAPGGWVGGLRHGKRRDAQFGRRINGFPFYGSTSS